MSNGVNRLGKETTTAEERAKITKEMRKGDTFRKKEKKSWLEKIGKIENIFYKCKLELIRLIK